MNYKLNLGTKKGGNFVTSDFNFTPSFKALYSGRL